MISADTYQPSLAFGLLLMGKPKKGKSILCCQFPNVGIIDCDNNMGGPIRWLREKNPEKLKSVWINTINVNMEKEKKVYTRPDNSSVEVPSMGEVPDECRWIATIRAVNDFLLKKEVETIVIDGLSSVAQYLIDHIVFSKSSGKKDGMTIQDWQPFRNMLSKLIINTRAKGRLFIMTCHEEPNKDEVTGALEWQPNLPSKLAGTIGGFFSDVWRCESEETSDTIIYKVRTAPRTLVPSLGSSLNLPAEFTFSWEGFAKRLYTQPQTKTP